jgi:predicted metal-dependent hydrolase
LTEEEVDQYIVLCTEVVISSAIQASIQVIQTQIDQEVEAGQKIPLTLVEAGSTARTEYNQCVQRQQKLLDSLKQKRSDRLSKQVQANASILNLVETWKDEENRKKLIKLAELRKESLKNEVKKLESMDEMKARILGLSEGEVLDG